MIESFISMLVTVVVVVMIYVTVNIMKTSDDNHCLDLCSDITAGKTQAKYKQCINDFCSKQEN